MQNKTVYIISGPTAVGKSKVAIELAKKIDGEIVNCDSIQLYKYMDIGTAKPTEEDMSEVNHHLFSIVEPSYNMTVAIYQNLAIKCIDNILSRGKTPVVVGGTGLYLNSILYDMDFAGKSGDDERREELEALAKKNGNEYMHQYLAGLDPDAAKRIHPNNIRKVIRAIEAYELGDGIKNLNNCKLNEKYDFKFFVLEMDREPLYKKINKRVEKIIEDGLLEEVKTLLLRGYEKSAILKAIGYKEILEYINENVDLDTAIDNMKKNTRHYAKRQYTWLKKYDLAKWIKIDPSDDEDISIQKIVSVILLEG